MDTKNYHILNGDALKEQFPSEIEGKRIIMRECLIDFPFGELIEDDFLVNRATYLSTKYSEITKAGYLKRMAKELNEMAQIPAEAEINLWFEDDLFCQANLWYVVHFLLNRLPDAKLFLVRPTANLRYGFSEFDQAGLIQLYRDRSFIENPSLFSDLWTEYQNGASEKIGELTQQISTQFPFINATIEAHLDRLPKTNYPGRPIATLMQIRNELKTNEFKPIFKAFSEREAIYGYGDLQVKNMLDELIAGSN